MHSTQTREQARHTNRKTDLFETIISNWVAKQIEPTNDLLFKQLSVFEANCSTEQHIAGCEEIWKFKRPSSFVQFYFLLLLLWWWIIMSHLFTADSLGRDFLSKSLGSLPSSRMPPSLLHNHNGPPHGNMSQVILLIFIFIKIQFFFSLFNFVLNEELRSNV